MSTSARPAALAVVCLAVLGTAMPAQSVLVVDPTGVFPDLQPAVDVADPGDTILVRTGSYSDVSIDKAVSLVADAGASASIDGTITVQNLPAGATVRVHGLSVTGEGFPQVFPSQPALIMADCLGRIWVEDCSLTGGNAVLGTSHGATANACAAVVLTDIDLSSGGGSGTGMIADGSNVYAFGCTMNGAPSVSAGTGGVGVDIIDATVFLHGSTAQGGDGAPSGGLGGGCIPAGDGGPGVRMTGSTSILRVVESTIAGGAGGAEFRFCVAGQPGPPSMILGGTFVPNLASSRFGLEAHPVAREGGSVDYTVTGPAGDAVAIAFAADTAPFYLPAIKAPLLPDLGGLLAIPVGVLPPSGTLTVPTTVPELGPGVDVVSLFVQVLAISAADGAIGGQGQALTLLDSSF